MRTVVLLWVTVFSLLSVASAQNVTVTVKLDSVSYLIGDWMQLQLRVEAPVGTRVFLPKKSEDFKQVEIVSAEKARTFTQNNRQVHERHYIVTSFDTGRIALSAHVTYYKQNDTTSYDAFSTPVMVSIRAVQLDSMASFRDIKDVLHVSLTFWDYALYVGIAVALLALLYYGYRWYKRKPEIPAVAEPEPAIPPYEIALEKLRALESKKLFEHGEHKSFQSELSEIIREFIEHSFTIPALEQTRNEILSAVAIHGFEPDLIAKLEMLLRISDMTKFAKYIPSTMEHSASLRSGYEMIERARMYSGYTNSETKEEAANV